MVIFFREKKKIYYRDVFMATNDSKLKKNIRANLQQKMKLRKN